MDFKEATKISMALIGSFGVIGLLFLIFGDGNIRGGTPIAATDDFGRLNTSRFFLLAWETFWLTSIAVFFIYVSKRALTAKSEEEIEKLEDFEPLLFKIVVGLLILAALMTLLLPALLDTNALPQYNQFNDEDVVYVQVTASTFSFQIDGISCQVSDQPDASCAEFETGIEYIFNATSVDTTHGFTIYDDNNILLMQGQIVPGYATRISFTFDHAGEYSIRCAEYCGAGHHIMLAAFTVVEGST